MLKRWRKGLERHSIAAAFSTLSIQHSSFDIRFFSNKQTQPFFRENCSSNRTKIFKKPRAASLGDCSLTFAYRVERQLQEKERLLKKNLKLLDALI